MADIFISYARADKDKVAKIASALETLGYDVWWDAESKTGESFRDEIAREVEAAKCVLVCWSPDAVESDLVIAEAEIGREQDKLVQVQIDGPDIGDGFTLPMPFGEYKCTSIRTKSQNYPYTHQKWHSIVGRVRDLAGLVEVKITSVDDLRVWLTNLADSQVISFAPILTGRLALRVAPFFSSNQSRNFHLHLTSLVGLALTITDFLQSVKLKAAHYIDTTSTATADSMNGTAAGDVAAAAAYAAQSVLTKSATIADSNFVLAALYSFRGQLIGSSYLWDVISADIACIAANQSGWTTGELSHQPLWHDITPTKELDPQILKDWLTEQAETHHNGWGYWAEWYDQVLTGTPRDTDLEVAILNRAETHFKDPKNPAIDAYLDDILERWEERKPPEQTTSDVTFEITEAGKLRAIPLKAQGASKEAVEDALEALTDKVEDWLEELSQNKQADPRLTRRAKKLENLINSWEDKPRVGRLMPQLHTFEGDLFHYEKATREQMEENPASTIASLSDLVRGLNALAACYLDDIRAYNQELARLNIARQDTNAVYAEQRALIDAIKQVPELIDETVEPALEEDFEAIETARQRTLSNESNEQRVEAQKTLEKLLADTSLRFANLARAMSHIAKAVYGVAAPLARKAEEKLAAAAGSAGRGGWKGTKIILRWVNGKLTAVDAGLTKGLEEGTKNTTKTVIRLGGIYAALQIFGLSLNKLSQIAPDIKRVLDIIKNAINL